MYLLVDSDDDKQNGQKHQIFYSLESLTTVNIRVLQQRELTAA